MKKKMNEYMTTLSKSGGFKVLEDIIEKKYKKFLHFYWCVKEYSDIIENVQYEFSNDNDLSIDISVNKKVDIDSLVSSLKRDMKGCPFTIKIKEKKEHTVHINIIYDERQKP